MWADRLVMLCKYLCFISGCTIAYFEPIKPMLLLLIGVYIADFITGVAASFKEGQFLKSSILRWSFVKILVYLGHALLIFFICEKMGLEKETILKVVKVMMWGVIYVEGLSINENLLRLYPHAQFLKLMHHLLSVEFLKYMPILANYFKENKDKNLNNNNGTNN